MKNLFFNEMQTKAERNPLQWMMGLLSVVLFFIVLYWLFKGLFTVLSWVAPVLLVATIILRYRVITEYGKFLWSVFNKNWILGLLGGALTVIGFPFVVGFLFVKALLFRKVDAIRQDHESAQSESFTDFEDLSDDIPDRLDLSELEKKEHLRSDDKYDNLFR